MNRPESESSLGVNGEFSKEIPRNEDLFSSKNQEIDEEVIFQSETRPQEILPSSELPPKPETQVKEAVALEQPQKETIKGWLQEEIKEAEEKGILTKEDKKKIVLASTLWVVNGVISTVVGNSVFATSMFLWQTRGNPLFLLYNLLPGALRLGTITASEKLTGVEFSKFSKALSLWPAFPGGWAMPYEVASTLGKHRTLFSKIKNRYLTTPLTSIRSGFQDFRSVFKR